MEKKYRLSCDPFSLLSTKHLIVFWAVFLGVVSSSLGAPAPVTHMTECERGVYTKCVINIGSSKEFRDKCQPGELLQCLRIAYQEEICTVNDAETVPTIKRLFAYVERRFRKEPAFCKDDRKFVLFVERIQDSLTVQGEGIEYTDPRSFEYSGSGGNGEIPDDTESEGEDDDVSTKTETKDESESVINKNNVNKRKDKNTKVSKNKSDKKENSVRKDTEFWKETSKLILKGKNNHKVQQGMIVYFDDQERTKKMKKEKEDIARAEKAWNELKNRYQRWYESSKFYRAK